MTGETSRAAAAESCGCRDCDCDATTPHPTGVCFTCREGNHHRGRYGDRLEAWAELARLEPAATAAVRARAKRIRP